jgi:RNA polymerase primary sigma factor
VKTNEQLLAELAVARAEGKPTRELENAIVSANLRLVKFIFKRAFSGSWYRYHDGLMSSGNYALLRAVKYYDPSFGTRFSTYACKAIWSYMQRELHNWTNPIKNNPNSCEFDPRYHGAE